MSQKLTNIYMDSAICEWQNQLRQNFEINAITLNTILFANDQVVFVQNENNLQVATFQLEKTMKTYNLAISATKTKIMASLGKYPRRSKIQIDGKIVEQVQHFNYLGCEVTFNYEEDLRNKVHKFQNMCGTIKRT